MRASDQSTKLESIDVNDQDDDVVVPKQKKKMKTSKKVKIEEPTGVVKQEHLVKDEVDDADSDYAVVPEVKAESKKRGAVKEDPQILKKRTRKQIKMKKCDFLDFEAEEDDDHRPIKYNEDDYKRETYTKKELERKTEAVSNVVKRLEERYKLEEGVEVKDEELMMDEDGEFAENNSYYGDDDAMDVDSNTFAREVSLPSNMDSKLWRLKVKPGMER